MKKGVLAVSLILFCFLVAGCNHPFTGSSSQNSTPEASDYEIGGLSHIFDGNPKEASVVPRSGKSDGIITIFYEGTGGTEYVRSMSGPVNLGTYTVTFDVGEAPGWNAAAGLCAGVLTIKAENDTPEASDYEISGLSHTYDGSPKEASIIHKSGKSEGRITIFYEGTDGTVFTVNTAGPVNIGSYTVTFDVEEAPGWNAAAGIFAGILTIKAANDTPQISDYEIGGLAHTFDGTPKEASIVPKSGKSDGKITIFYEGTDGAVYTKKTAAPSAVGAYAVTFDVEEAAGWNAVSGLEAGVLIIKAPDKIPEEGDYEIGISPQTYDGSPRPVAIQPRDGKSPGSITIFYLGIDGTNYEKSAVAPIKPGKYSVTFDVEKADGYTEAKNLVAGTLVIDRKQLSVTGLKAEGRPYDGTADVVLSGWTLNGVVGSDDVSFSASGTVANADAGDNKPVTVTAQLAGADAGYYTLAPLAAITVNISKAAGAAVAVPVPDVVTQDSISIFALTLPGNTQTVEYAINTSGNTPAASAWQDAFSFSKLNPATAYYIFARSKANINYNAGVHSVLTLATLGSAGVNVEFWINEDNKILSSTAAVTIKKSGTAAQQSFTATAGNGYSGAQWYVRGVSVGTGQSITINAANYSAGTYRLDVTVYKGTVPYSSEVLFIVMN